jgi:hypothetical protein
MANSVWMSLVRVPYFIMLVLAVVVAVARWSRHPLASALLTVGCLTDVVLQLFGAFVIPALAQGDSQKMMLLFALNSLVGTLAFGLVILAVFVDRKSDGTTAPRVRW